MVASVHMATKVERQLRKGHVRPTFNSGSSSSWKPNLKREGTVWPRSFVPSRTKPSKAIKVMSLLMPKVNLKVNLNVPVMLNVSGVRDMDIMLQSVQTRES